MTSAPDRWKQVDAHLRDWVDERDLSGAVLVTRAGATEFEGCYGMANRADGVPVRPGTRFGLASATKMFTAVTVADLVRSGAAGFHTPVIDVLPPHRRPTTLRADVTIHHLLTHTSGIADYFEEDEPGDYADLWADRPAYTMTRPADFLPLFGDRAPYRAPGGSFQYSNAGYVVLALVIEELTGGTYIEAVTRRVFEPAAMTASGFFALDEAWPDVAIGYLPPHDPGGRWRSNIYRVPIVGGGDGGALSTTGDLDRFLRAYADGTLVGAETRDVMLRAHCRVEEQITMGYGVFTSGEGTARRWGHGGGDPGVEVLVHRLPDLDVNVIVLCNMSDLTGDVRGLLLDAIDGAV